MADRVVVVKDTHSVARGAFERDRKCLGVESRADQWAFRRQHREHLPQCFLVDRGGMPNPHTLNVPAVGTPHALINELCDER